MSSEHKISHSRGEERWSHDASFLTQLECDDCWRLISKRLLPRLGGSLQHVHEQFKTGFTGEAQFGGQAEPDDEAR